MNRSDINYHYYVQYRSLIKQQVKKAYREYVARVEASVIHEPKYFWTFIRNKKGNSRIPSRMYKDDVIFNSPKTIVNAFKQYFSSVYRPPYSNFHSVDNCEYNYMPNVNISEFSEDDIIAVIRKLKNKPTAGHDQIPSFLVKDCGGILVKPLTIIFNLILKSSVFPDVWKISRICPILKSGDPCIVINYRPISILCNFAKLFEMLLYDRIYLSVKCYLSTNQHGFMNGRSTTTNLIQFGQYVSQALDNKQQVDVIYTDFSKAFDVICHAVLLHKLKNFGFSDNLISLFSSYLSNRQQFVAYGGYVSNNFIASSGVPQGSNLGPLLFLMFVNDITKIISCEKLLFADDLKIFGTITRVQDCIYIQQQLNNVIHWCRDNYLSLNVNKCKVVSYTRKKHKILHNYVIDNIVLDRCVSIKDLGVYFDDKFTFTEHIQKITSTAVQTLGFIIRNCKYFSNLTSLKTLYFSLVRSRLEYCVLIWFPYYNIYKMDIEAIQRRFLKFLYYRDIGNYPVRGYDHGELLNMFDIPSLDVRRNQISIIFLYKLVNNQVDAPSILQQLNFYVPRVCYRGSITFYCSKARTNLLQKSPLLVMCNNFNNISVTCDIHNCSISAIKELCQTNFNVYSRV